jgi:hypothetical protein
MGVRKFWQREDGSPRRLDGGFVFSAKIVADRHVMLHERPPSPARIEPQGCLQREKPVTRLAQQDEDPALRFLGEGGIRTEHDGALSLGPRACEIAAVPQRKA